jgi:hypothetical protein
MKTKYIQTRKKTILEVIPQKNISCSFSGIKIKYDDWKEEYIPYKDIIQTNLFNNF